jgi:hypothetical protein
MKMKLFSLFCLFVFFKVNTLDAQKKVTVLYQFNGQGTIGSTNVTMQLNMQSNGVIKGNYTTIGSSKNATYNLEGNSPIGDSQQTTIYIKESEEEKGYFILPYDIEDLEILIGKWYNLDGSKSQNVYIKRNH